MNKFIILISSISLIIVILITTIRPDVILAAEILVDSTTELTNTNTDESGPSTVWINDQTGFVFYEDSGGGLSMGSTTDGGASWTSGRNVDSVNTGDVVHFAVWWDGWTIPGTTTTYIHIATIDLANDSNYYTRYDTTNNTLSTTVLGTTQGGTCTEASSCYVAITKAKDGRLFMTAADASDAWVVTCTTTCTTAANWSEITGAYTFIGDDYPLLAPVPDETNDVMLIWWDISGDQIFSNRRIATSSTWASTTILSNADDNTTYDGQLIGVGVSTSTGGGLAFVFVDDANDYITADHDVRFFLYATTTRSWSEKTNVISAASGIAGAKVAYDEINATWYVTYIRRSTIGTNTTGNIYYKYSSDGGTSWSSEQGPVNTTSDDINGLSMNVVSSDRIGVQWNYTTAPTDDQVFSDTIVDITAPGGGGGGDTQDPGVFWFGLTIPFLRKKICI